MVIVKSLTTTANGSWSVYHIATGPTKSITLEQATTPFTDVGYWNNTSPTASVFSLGTYAVANQSSANYIAYAFHSVDGFSKIGSYTGTGATGNTIVTGFEPAWVMIKSTSSSGTAWNMWDNKRTPYDMLRANASDSEFSGPGRITFSTTGFQLLDNDASRNSSGGNYIFMAFAADPT